MPVSLGQAISGYANSGASEVNSSALGNIEPYVTTLSQRVAPVQQYNAPAAGSTSQSGLSKFAHFIGGLGSGIGHLAEGAGKWIGTQAIHMATAIPREIISLPKAYFDNKQLDNINLRNEQNSARLQSAASAYKGNHITRTQYTQELSGILKDQTRNQKNSQSSLAKINIDSGQAKQAVVDSVSTVITLLTAGVGDISLIPTQLAEKSAADYLGSMNANAFLSNVEKGLNHFATNPEAFGQLSKPMQMALQRASAEVIAKSTTQMTGQQIARAAAVNLAFKYPLQFSYLSSVGTNFYKQMDQQKYGQAIRDVATQSLMLLSGGPIGEALKYAGKFKEGVSGAMFSRTPFIDALSKGIGNGSPDGLYNAIRNSSFGDYKFFSKGKLITLSDDQARQRVMQNIRALEATNLNAVEGKDSEAAALRVLKGMNGYEGLSMSNFTHEQALKNMSNFAEAQRTADFYGTKAGVKNITVGRVDARDKAHISAAVAQAMGDSKAAAHQALDNFASENKLKAWPNNDNFMTQLHALIDKHDNPDAVGNAINNIKARTAIEGLPSTVSKSLSEMGYIPITPGKLEAPFREGSAEKLQSMFAKNNDFFQKTSAPLPVLSHVGGMLTAMGLSPLATSSRVYAMYNAALSERLQGLDFLSSTAFKGETDEHTADQVVKALSDYAKNPTRGGISIQGTHIRPPITDLKLLTRRDIQAALSVNSTQAKQIGSAVRNAMLDVPLAVKGLGPSVVNAAENIPLFRSYIRTQGAGKFAWNPVFMGKLATKTEFASQALSGGKVPVVLENILGRGAAIESTRGLLRDAGVLDQPARNDAGEIIREVTPAIGGSEAQVGGTVGSNLSHKLMPIQERSIAGMINKFATKAGMSPADYITHFPDETRSVVQMIAGYDKGSEFLHSPLVKTLNIAFFPFRFETKVASIMAKSLAQQDTVTQVAVINGIVNAHNWLNSPEGLSWYSQNSNVLKFISYFSPTSTLSTVGTMLSGLSHDDWKTTVGAWQLGGLPFGWIPQILNDEGANIQPGYVDPATGQPLAKQIPNTAKAQLQTALGDMMGSLFTYPGAELGLESKTKVDKFMAGAITGGQAKSAEFTQQQPQLSAQQQRYSQAVQQANQSKKNVTPATPPTNTQTIQQVGTGQAAPVYTAAELKAINKAAAGPKPKKLKKGQQPAQLPS